MRDGGVNPGVAAALIRADHDEILVLAIRRLESSEDIGGLAVLLVDDLVANAALALENVDRGIVSRRRHLPREHDVAVEDRSRRISDRLIEVVAVDENRVDAGDCSRHAWSG